MRMVWHESTCGRASANCAEKKSIEWLMQKQKKKWDRRPWQWPPRDIVFSTDADKDASFCKVWNCILAFCQNDTNLAPGRLERHSTLNTPKLQKTITHVTEQNMGPPATFHAPLVCQKVTWPFLTIRWMTLSRFESGVFIWHSTTLQLDEFTLTIFPTLTTKFETKRHRSQT